MFLAYPGVSLKVLRVFQCREVDGVAYLEADMRLQVQVARSFCTCATVGRVGFVKSRGRAVAVSLASTGLRVCLSYAVLFERVGRLRGLQSGHCRGVRHWASLG
jgi:hypothetical protein